MKTKIVQNENKAEKVPAEIIVDSILEISAGVRAIRSTRMTDKLLVLMLHDITKVSKTEITYVLNALNSLESTYLKKPVK